MTDRKQSNKERKMHHGPACIFRGKEVDEINEEAYFEYLLDTYQNLVYSVCFKSVGNQFDAEDLTQETYLSIYKNLSAFDRRYEKAWVCRIASNKCLDFLKSAGRRSQPAGDEYFLTVEDKGATPEEAYLQEESKQYVYTICQQLKEPYREIATAHFYREQPVKEIAGQKGKNVKTIQTQVYRAKAMIKKLMEAPSEKHGKTSGGHSRTPNAEHKELTDGYNCMLSQKHKERSG